MKLPRTGILAILATAMGLGGQSHSMGSAPLILKPHASGFDPMTVLNALRPAQLGIEHHPISYQRRNQRKIRLARRRIGVFA